MSKTFSKKNGPLVSIGIPVYNEEKFVSETLDSLLAQDYNNIEIIISDNASTDRTGEICEAYSKNFSQIRYSRFEINKGQAENFKKVLVDSKGEFFMWAAGHDLWSPNFISACLKKIKKNRASVVIVPASEWIDENGAMLTKESGFNDTRGMDIIARYFTLFWGNMHSAYGLMRTEIIKTWPIRGIIGEDLIMMTFLAFRGDFIHEAKAVWSRREFRFEKSYAERLQRYKKGEQIVASTQMSKLIPFTLLAYYLICTVLKSDTSFLTKMLICFLLFPSMMVRYFSGKAQYQVI